MKIKQGYILPGFLLLILSACSGGVQEPPKAVLASPADTVDLMQNTGSDKLLHYWDDFNFSDTAAINNPDIAEQKLVDFIAAAGALPETVSASATRNMLSLAKRTPYAFNYFVNQFEHYLYDANSPAHSDALYEPVLAFMVDSTTLDDASRFRYQTRLELARKNKVGMPANDFNFQLSTGQYAHLYGIMAPFTLLFFYDPDCSHCQQTIADLRQRESFRNWVTAGNLKILTVYAGSNEKLWKKFQKEIPANWDNGFEKEGKILREQRYDLRASPTIYLLDENKKVLLKDTNLDAAAQQLTPTHL